MRASATAVVWLALTSAAAASDWQSQNIGDHLEGNVGVASFVGGFLDGDRGKEIAYLRVQCAKNSTTVVIYSEHIYFGMSGAGVRYKLDEGPVQTARWDTCQNSRCVGLWNGQGIPFIKAMFGKKELRVVIELRFSGPINGTFHVDGAEGALADLGEKCGWLPKPPAKKAAP